MNEVNRQLQAHGLMVNKAIGAVVDYFCGASRQDHDLEVNAAGKATAYEDGSQPGIACEDKHSTDPDVTWVKKGKRSYFGYCSY